MSLAALVGPGAKVLDVGPPDVEAAMELADEGVSRYLGLLPAERLSLGAHAPSALTGRFQPLVSAQQVYRNSADVLLLRPSSARTVWGVRDLGHVEYVAVERASRSAWLETHAALLVSRTLGRVERLGTHPCGGRPFEVFRVNGHRRAQPRRYLSEVVGVEGLIHRMGAEGLHYVVLRWFEQLPALEAGEDLDLLVADEHLAQLHGILAEEPGTIPVDVYSTTGLEGADFQGMSYYPPSLAARILDTAERHTSGARVPAPCEHFHSLAYHAVYHKGASSGIPSSVVETFQRPEHDYGSALGILGGRLGLEAPATLEDLDNTLAQQGWRPPMDTLRRLAPGNGWVQGRFFATGAEPEQQAELPEPAIFFIRERAAAVLDAEEILRVFDEFGFEVLVVRDLPEADRARCIDNVRGGNWGRGPFAVSGGDPVRVVVAVHYGPRRPPSALRKRYPRLTNGDVLHLKVRVRELVEAKVGVGQAFNPVHSSDDEHETWEYIALAVPEEAEQMRAQLDDRRRGYRTELPVRRVLSTGRRAKVEVVDRPAGPAVRKTYARHTRRFLEREIEALRTLGPVLAEIPPVLAEGPHWVEVPYYDDALAGRYAPGSGRLLPLGLARAMVDVLRRVHAEGGDLIDAKPANFVLDEHHGLKLVDLEFFHRYPGDPPPFEENYAFAGVPASYDGDVPFGPLSYEALWRPWTGLSRQSLVHHPVWRQHLHRSGFRLARAHRYPRRAARGAVRILRAAAQRGRAHAGAAYRRWARERARRAL